MVISKRVAAYMFDKVCILTFQTLICIVFLLSLMSSLYISRTITPLLHRYIDHFPIVVLLGARQVGKTTLARHEYPHYHYVSLEDPDTRAFATDDPRGFLATCGSQAIIDEIQRVPILFSYLQRIVDESPSFRYILTGSHNYLLMEQVTQSLAGRAGIITLLPLSYEEVSSAQTDMPTLLATLHRGSYPRVIAHGMPPALHYPNYIQTYIERDVRLLKNIGDISSFARFVKLCAGRVGQILNYSSLATDAGVSVQTVRSWLSIVETSFLFYTLPPYHQNFNKRIIKMPKLYCYDTGLLCSLLGINEPEQIATHFAQGAIMENYVLGELFRAKYNHGLPIQLSYWRDSNGLEVDCIIEHTPTTISLVEIKASATLHTQFFSGIAKVGKLFADKGIECRSTVVYGGSEHQVRTTAQALPWFAVEEILGQ